MDNHQYVPSYRARLVRQYGARIPTTGEGLITGYYRSDLLPHSDPGLQLGHSAGTEIQGSGGAVLGQDVDPDDLDGMENAPTQAETQAETQPAEVLPKKEIMGSAADGRGHTTGTDDAIAQALRYAYVELNFDHGYPAHPDGMPFWLKMSFESGFAFACFQIYLESGEQGPRELHALSTSEELLNIARQQTGNADLAPAQLNFMMQEYFILHFWYARAKAFDLYKETAFRHQRLRRQVSTEDKHFSMAAGLLEKLSTYFASARFLDEMTPKAALDAFSKLVAIQRVSIGLPAGGPLPVNQQPEATSFEMIMRNVAQKQGVKSSPNEGFGAGTSHTRDMLEQILQDPNAAANLQEVIIRVSSIAIPAEEVPEHRFMQRQNRGSMHTDEQVIDAELREIGAQPR